MARFYITFCLLVTMAAGQENSRVSLVGGIYIFRSDWGSSWVPLSDLQATLTNKPNSSVRLDWNVEYYFLKHTYPRSMGLAIPKAGRRHDLAFYPSLVLFDIVQLGLGAYYSYRGQVVKQNLWNGTATTLGPMSFIRIFYQLAVVPAIAVSDRWAIRVGLSFRDQEVDESTTPLAFRAGASFSF